MDYNTLKKVIPPDQALANKALSRSLQQIKGVFNTNLPELANTVQGVETNKGLSIINSLTTPVPSTVKNYYINTFATGTGENNTILLTDIIGTAIGTTHNTELPRVLANLNSLQSSNALYTLSNDPGNPTSPTNGVFVVMINTMNGDYDDPINPGNVDIPAGVYGTGYYSSIDSALQTLVTVAQGLVANIAVAYPTSVANLNASFNAMGNQLVREQTNQAAADIIFTELVANSKSATMSFVSNLHTYGLDTLEGGTAQYLEAVADTSTQAGQAVISSMREGRNIYKLGRIGIGTDTQISSEPENPQRAPLSSGQDSAAEAAARAAANQ